MQLKELADHANELVPASLCTNRSKPPGRCGFMPAGLRYERLNRIRAGRWPCKKSTAYFVQSKVCPPEVVFEVCLDHAHLVRTWEWTARIWSA